MYLHMLISYLVYMSIEFAAFQWDLQDPKMELMYGISGHRCHAAVEFRAGGASLCAVSKGEWV